MAFVNPLAYSEWQQGFEVSGLCRESLNPLAYSENLNPVCILVEDLDPLA